MFTTRDAPGVFFANPPLVSQGKAVVNVSKLEQIRQMERELRRLINEVDTCSLEGSPEEAMQALEYAQDHLSEGISLLEEN